MLGEPEALQLILCWEGMWLYANGDWQDILAESGVHANGVLANLSTFSGECIYASGTEFWKGDGKLIIWVQPTNIYMVWKGEIQIMFFLRYLLRNKINREAVTALLMPF